MKKNWTTTKLIVAGSIGAVFLMFAISGSALQMVVGITGASGLINSLVSSTMYVLACLLIGKFGAATIAGLVYYTLGLPLAIGGTPGFLPKILIGLVVGLTSDFLYLALRNNKKLASLCIGAASQLAIGVLFFLIIKLSLMPGPEYAFKFFESSLGIVLSLIVVLGGGVLGGGIGYFLFGKIKNTSVVKRIQR